MMIGTIDNMSSIQNSEKTTQPRWHKSQSFSSATTADDWVASSPKQRWADVSDDDEDIFSSLDGFGDSFGAQNSTIAASTDDSEATSSSNEGGLTVLAEVEEDRPESEAAAATTPAFKTVARIKKFDSKPKSPPGSPTLGATSFGISPFFGNAASSPSPQGSPTAAAAAGAVVDSDVPASPTDTFSVELVGIPVKLRTSACMDAILWAAGVQRDLIGQFAKDSGEVVVQFSSIEAATNCCKHFQSCHWQTGKLKVNIMQPNSEQASSSSRDGRAEQQHQQQTQQPRHQYQQKKSSSRKSNSSGNNSHQNNHSKADRRPRTTSYGGNGGKQQQDQAQHQRWW